MMPTSVDELIADELEELFGDEGFFPVRTVTCNRRARNKHGRDYPTIILVTYRQFISVIVNAYYVVITTVPPVGTVAAIPISHPDLYGKTLDIVLRECNTI